MIKAAPESDVTTVVRRKNMACLAWSATAQQARMLTLPPSQRNDIIPTTVCSIQGVTVAMKLYYSCIWLRYPRKYGMENTTSMFLFNRDAFHVRFYLSDAILLLSQSSE